MSTSLEQEHYLVPAEGHVDVVRMYLNNIA